MFLRGLWISICITEHIIAFSFSDYNHISHHTLQHAFQHEAHHVDLTSHETTIHYISVHRCAVQSTSASHAGGIQRDAHEYIVCRAGGVPRLCRARWNAAFESFWFGAAFGRFGRWYTFLGSGVKQNNRTWIESKSGETLLLPHCAYFRTRNFIVIRKCQTHLREVNQRRKCSYWLMSLSTRTKNHHNNRTLAQPSTSALSFAKFSRNTRELRNRTSYFVPRT